LNCILE
jgi:hypothetical protein